MTNETGESLIYLDTVVDVWNATKETYSNIDNTSAISISRISWMNCDKEILMSLNTTSLSQGIVNNWTFMQTWSGSVLKIESTLVEKDCMYQFLLGLNKNLDEVRGRVLTSRY
ncbi:hypothetical protein PHAVU_002G094400 [Phaseolus vulgaris]|uniref:Uncharacterized protein n=1 Tax=Phaseolus vulgaris TaxID=3885 RepID=V7CK61_PHAVU|nr:hypothetical protein PHAVU_002G094400g [Phaseolus vulgaris]ESW29733.1 hypothetical protein PHAVU_002G094400g [Phaseolus vulgaris]